MEDVNTRKQIFGIFFSEITIDTVLEDSTPEKLANIIAQWNETEKLLLRVKQRELTFLAIKVISYVLCILTAIRYSTKP